MRISDRCVQTLLNIQALTNTAQQAAAGKIVCHSKCPGEGKPTNQEIFGKMRYGRLILNTGIYQCAKRDCATLDAVHKSRIGLFQIKGAERKKHMEACDEETEGGELVLIYGGIEHMVDGAENLLGLTQKQCRDWRKIECMDTNTRNSRGRSLSKRRKDKKEAKERVDRETSANRRD